MTPFTLGRLFVASIVLAILSLGSLVATTSDNENQARFHITPTTLSTKAGETFVVTVEIESPTPVNVFAGELQFDAKKISVQEISYNESAADLWAEKPWYENGDGTLNFTGGTTQPGGFTGTSPLLSVTFLVNEPGVSAITLVGGRMLKHDGLGTDETLGTPLDAIVTITPNPEEVSLEEPKITTVVSSAVGKDFDISGDGEYSIADVSILLSDLVGGDNRSDLNGDGKVSLADLSILLETF